MSMTLTRDEYLAEQKRRFGRVSRYTKVLDAWGKKHNRFPTGGKCIVHEATPTGDDHPAYRCGLCGHTWGTRHDAARS